MKNTTEKISGVSFYIFSLGGTADLSAVEVLPDGLLKELCKDQGLCVGGQNVNEAFFQSCHNSFSGNHNYILFKHKITVYDLNCRVLLATIMFEAEGSAKEVRDLTWHLSLT